MTNKMKTNIIATAFALFALVSCKDNQNEKYVVEEVTVEAIKNDSVYFSNGTAAPLELAETDVEVGDIIELKYIVKKKK